MLLRIISKWSGCRQSEKSEFGQMLNVDHPNTWTLSTVLMSGRYTRPHCDYLHVMVGCGGGVGNQWGWEGKELQDAGINNSEDDKGVL